jgi:hypothetical protein
MPEPSSPALFFLAEMERRTTFDLLFNLEAITPSPQTENLLSPTLRAYPLSGALCLVTDLYPPVGFEEIGIDLLEARFIGTNPADEPMTSCAQIAGVFCIHNGMFCIS